MPRSIRLDRYLGSEILCVQSCSGPVGVSYIPSDLITIPIAVAMSTNFKVAGTQKPSCYRQLVVVHSS